jgi:hypothetical protein
MREGGAAIMPNQNHYSKGTYHGRLFGAINHLITECNLITNPNKIDKVDPRDVELAQEIAEALRVILTISEDKIN